MTSIESNPIQIEKRRHFAIVDFVAIALLLIAILLGIEFWRDWFRQVDQTLCAAFVVLGLFLYIASSARGVVQDKHRTIASWTAWALAIACIIANALGFSVPANLSISLVVVGWMGLRLHSNSLGQAVFVGVLLMLPWSIVQLLHFGWLDWTSRMASLLSVRLLDAVGIAFATEGNSIWTERGVADAFGQSGEWNSPITLLGFAIGVLLFQHTNLVSAIITILLTPWTWIACRGGIIAFVVCLSMQTGQWIPTNALWMAISFSIALLSIFGISSFFNQIFNPLPMEAFNSESPTPCYLWNWFCFLPTLIYRVPETSVTAERWRSALKLAHKEKSLGVEVGWLVRELVSLTNPIHFGGGMIDVFRGWTSTRNWMLIGSSMLGLLAPFLCFGLGIGSLQQGESTAQFLSDTSERICKTTELEASVNALLEPEFSKATQPIATLVPTQPKPISDSTKKHVELFADRVIELNPKQPLAHYRRAMCDLLNDKRQQAIETLKLFSNGRLGNYPAGNAFLAKLLIIQRMQDQSVDMRTLISQIEKGSESAKIDGRLLRDYSKILESQGNTQKAIEIAIKASKIQPELILDLTQLYYRTKHDDLKETAESAEAFFRKRINVANENEADRISVANACFLMGDTDRAIEVLEESIQNGKGGLAVRRELSELYRLNYRRTQKKNEDGTFSADFALLEKVLDMDPANPNIASEIAQMLPLNLHPSEKLLAALQTQIDQGITTAGTHLLIAEAYYDKGNLAAAQKQWKIAIDKDPNNAMALNNYAYCIANSDAPDYEQALEILDRAIKIAPRNAHILDTIGGVLIQMQRYKEAINKLEAAIALEQDFISPRKKLIEAYRQAGMEDMASHQQRALSEIESKKK